MNSTVKEAQAIRGNLLDPWLGFYFLQSLLINYALGYPFSLLYAIAFTCVLLLLWRVAPRLQKTVQAFSSLAAGGYFPFGQAYGAPNFNTLLALHSTNMEESAEILTIFPWYSYLIGLFIIGLGVVALRRRPSPERGWGYAQSLCLVVATVALLYAPVHNYLTGWGFRLQETGYPVARFVKDIIVNNNDVLEEQARMQALASKKDTWHVLSVAPRYQIYMVVIGESARRDALGAFGGHWDNTPFASQVKGTLFMDYISASASTQKSLGLTLNRVISGKPQYQDNFVTLANRAGFQSWWFSNQGQIGEYDTAIASIARRADEVQFLKSGDFEADKNTQDDELLKMTAQVFAAPRSQPQLIVLHLMGSHPQACDRTRGKYQVFVQSRETSCYLHTMTQTDTLLSKLYQQLQGTGQRFSLVYFSDHGLAFKERGKEVQYLAHDDTVQQSFQVPFMVLSSDDTAHRKIKARRSANDFLNFFSQWTGIKARELQPTYPFMSKQSAGPIYVTNFKLQRVDYTHLGSDPFVTSASQAKKIRP
ncbi:phosphoethanolamine transferase [Entomohabitans teleogrylli]|uniref:phosphoethanolamine transferase n=1 Tax=Entomohabitans teleogrylli TaxID=1384589 RepID=UPI00073D9B87|nr:phosphoethanolamine transferase [Entomohabitans teleogrylli]